MEPVRLHWNSETNIIEVSLTRNLDILLFIIFFKSIFKTYFEDTVFSLYF